MEDTLIEFETAKLAKEKGFNIPTKNCFADGDDKALPYNTGNSLFNNDNKLPYYSAPTQSLLRKWLREEHKIHINVDTVISEKVFHGYDFCVYKNWKDKVNQMINYLSSNDKLKLYKTYEEALEFALLEGLKLI